MFSCRRVFFAPLASPWLKKKFQENTAGDWYFRSPMDRPQSRISTRCNRNRCNRKLRATQRDHRRTVDLADFDREAVLAAFLVESEEGLDSMEQALVQMESSPSDLELLHSIFRVAHTLKGNATSLELS